MVETIKKTKVNLFCSVSGCRTKLPHREDRHVNAIMRTVEDSKQMCTLVMEGLAQLGNSATNDLANRNALGFLTRQRQIQELYLKTLYLLLIAGPAEQEHMVSGDMPNGMAGYYRSVNKIVYRNQTDFEAIVPGLNGDRFSVMDTLNDGAHVSFKSLFMARGYFNHPTLVMTPERFADYIKKQLSTLNYMHGMFQAGKPREDVLKGVQTLYRLKAEWEEQQRVAKDVPAEPS